MKTKSISIMSSTEEPFGQLSFLSSSFPTLKETMQAGIKNNECIVGLVSSAQPADEYIFLFKKILFTVHIKRYS